jgi:Protein of unknown function (DUF2470)
MNGDHTDDNLTIARAFADVAAESATMIGLDSDTGRWQYSTGGVAHEIALPWSAPIVERADIRREVVALYHSACLRLGLPVRPH